MIDLTDIIAQYYRDARPEARGDELALHVGDLPGCDRATFSRISAREQASAPFQTRVQWDIGHDYEARVRDALEWWAPRNGYTVVHGGVVGFGMSDGVLVARELPADLTPEDLAAYARGHRLLIGHPDFTMADSIGDRYVVDTKWSGRFPGAKDPMPYDYLLKTAAYAFAVGADLFTPFVYYGAKKLFRFEWELTANYIDQIEKRVKELLPLYDGYEPAAEPPTHYAFNLCNYCNALDCEKNKARGAA